MGLKSAVKKILTKRQDREYERRLKARQVSYEDWIRREETREIQAAERGSALVGQTGQAAERGSVPVGQAGQAAEHGSVPVGQAGQAAEHGSVPVGQTGQAAEHDFRSGGGIWLFRASRGSMAGERAGITVTGIHAEDAIYSYFLSHPDALIVYGDEDVASLSDGRRRSPWFKPDWSPDTFHSWFYFGSLVAVREGLIAKCSFREQIRRLDCCKGQLQTSCDSAPGLEPRITVCEYPDGETIYKWMLELTALAGGYERGCHTIGHIKSMLFHCETEEQQKEYLTWCGNEKGKLIEPLPLVSVVIPSKDNPGVLRQAVESLVRTCSGLPLEILVVDNGSSAVNRASIEAFLESVQSVPAQEAGKNKSLSIQYLYEPMEFHFSRMCNLGAQKAAGELLLFLNDDVELYCKGWLERMAAKALRPYTGAVGLKLLYPDGKRIQHAGITNLPMGPVHKLQFLNDAQDYYFGRNRMDINVLAVTGACLMVGRDKFWEAGGFAPELAVAFNDVDLCFALHELGYYNVVVNRAYAGHHESLSRGDDESAKKQTRLQAERKKLYERHPGLEGKDPYYCEGLNRDGLDTRIRPAYLTSGNVSQRVTFNKQVFETKEYREDRCLLLRVEYAGADSIQGYSVVLGDDNACYEKQLVLESVDKGEKCLYTALLEGQYRPDLLENMPDQTNVALCGFLLEWDYGSLPKGSYRIGAAARNRITGLKLINWSTRVLTVD